MPINLTSAGRHLGLRYGVAVASLGLALLLRTVLDPHIYQYPLVIFFAAVAAAGWFGGFGPALLCTVLSFLAAVWMAVIPRQLLWTKSGLIVASGYLLVTLSLAFFSRVAHFSLENAQNRQRELEQTIDEQRATEESLRNTNAELGRITAELKAALKGQEREKERFEGVLERLPVCVALLTPDHRVVFANRMFRERFGEPAGAHCFEHLFQSPVPCEFCQTFRVLETRQPHQWECIRPGGRIYQVFDDAFTDTDGSDLILQANIDITESRRTQERLSEQAVLLELAHDAIWVADLNGRISFWNRGAEQTYGWSSEEAVGQSIHKLLGTASSIALDKIDAANLEHGQWEGELAQLTRSGQAIMVASRWSFERNGADKPVAVLAINRDITKRKRAEDVLAQKSAELERSNAELQQFAYVASHDLQEPLRMVTNFTQLLSERYASQLDDDAREFIGFAVGGAVRMQGLIQDLLAYSRVETKSKSVGAVNCNEILRSAVANLHTVIAENGALVRLEDLPVVRADATQMVQLFQNLIGNSIKFKRANPPQVHISAVRKGDDWVFSVRDNGIGIEPRFADRIFVLFQRLHHSEEYPGTGIGLALCKKIVERHGGNIRVESHPGEGSTFIFSIPAASPETDIKPKFEVQSYG